MPNQTHTPRNPAPTDAAKTLHILYTLLLTRPSTHGKLRQIR